MSSAPSPGASPKIAAILIAAVQAYLEDEDGRGEQRPGNRVWKMALRDRVGWSRASSWTGRG